MCNNLTQFNKIKFNDIQKSMDGYYHGRENSTTRNYFIYKGKLYPIMNIVKIAIESSNDISNNQLYDNLPCCKYILERLLVEEVSFYKLIEDV